MKIFRRVRRDGKLKRLWEFRAPVPIWRIFPSSTGKLVVECRDAEKKRASFSCLQSGNGRLLWAGKEFVDPWWVGVEGLHDEMILFHGFASPDMPLHKGIHAVHMKSGDAFWSQSDLVFEYIRNGKVIGSLGGYGARRFSELSPDSGKVLAQWEEAREGNVARRESGMPEGALHPVLIAAGLSGLPSPWQTLLRSRGVVGPVEYVEEGSLGIFSFGVRGKRDMDQWLVILRSGDPAEAYSDIIQHDTTTFVPDSFVLLERKLFYIKEGMTIAAVDLSSE